MNKRQGERLIFLVLLVIISIFFGFYAIIYSINQYVWLAIMLVVLLFAAATITLGAD